MKGNVLRKSSAQGWFNENYSDKTKTITELDISEKGLKGTLKIERFENLEKLTCSRNQLSKLIILDCPKLALIKCSKNKLESLNISNCPCLSKLYCHDNLLADFDFTSLNQQNLTVIDLMNNNFSKRDLSCFSQFVNLTELLIGTNERRTATRVMQRFFNRFYGSLEFLKSLACLEKLDISGTDVDSGLEYLSRKNLKEINCSTNGRVDAKVIKLEGLMKEFEDYWRKGIDIELMIDNFESRASSAIKTNEEKGFDESKSRRSSTSTASTVFSRSKPLSRIFYFQEKLEKIQKQNQELKEKLTYLEREKLNWEREKVELLKKLVNSQKKLKKIKQTELEKLINDSKSELDENSQQWLKLLLETKEDTARNIAKENLEKKLDNEVIQSLLDEKNELAEFEEQLQDLQVQEKQSEAKFLEIINWKDIHSDFTEELVVKWKEFGFTREETKDWINIDIKVDESRYVNWLVNIKGGDYSNPEWIIENANNDELRKEYNTKNILIIGRTGNGKSTLANVISNSSEFEEHDSIFSGTKEIKSREFLANDINYRLVDTIGIGDNSGLTEKQILEEIAETVYSLRNGINQILFVTKDRFDENEMNILKLLKGTIFDDKINDFITIVRTNSSSFENSEWCNEEKEKIVKAGGEMAELVNSCNNFLFVDNPPNNFKKRMKSKEIILKHLKNCHDIYNPSSFKSLVEEIREPMKELENLEKTNDNDENSTRSYEVSGEEQQKIIIINKIINNVEKHMEEQAIKRGLRELWMEVMGRTMRKAVESTPLIVTNCKIM